MKNSKELDAAFQGLMKPMAESMEASSAKGRAKGAVKKCQEELAKLPNWTELCEMAKIEAVAVKMNAALNELAKLTAVANEKRKVFDARLNAIIGDISKKDGVETAKQWDLFIQKSYVLGMLKATCFYYVSPGKRTSKTGQLGSLQLIAEAYMQAHNVLGMKIVYPVNARSMQERDADLVKALAVAETGTDPDKVLRLRAAQAGLRKHGGFLLTMKLNRENSARRSTAVQQAQAKLITGRVKQSSSVVENTVVTMGEANGTQPLPAPRKKGPAFTSPRKGGEQK